MECEIYSGNIYKFLGVNGAIKTLEYQKLKFSSPTRFNDPLDGTKLIFNFPVSQPREQDIQRVSGFDENRKKYMNQFIADRLGCDFLDNVFKRSWYETTKDLDFKELKAEDLKINKEIALKIIHQDIFEKYEIEKYKVCCFSKVYKSTKSFLMWSHYGESHFGICLRFSPSFQKNTSSHYNKPIIINYTQRLTTVNSKEEFLSDKWLLNKLNIWKYEQEVRIIRKSIKGQAKSLFKFQKEDLVGVIFGYNTTNQTILKVKDILSANYNINAIKFEKIVIDETSTKLSSKGYDINNLITM